VGSKSRDWVLGRSEGMERENFVMATRRERALSWRSLETGGDGGALADLISFCYGLVILVVMLGRCR
jgi:hypothetical protein